MWKWIKDNILLTECSAPKNAWFCLDGLKFYKPFWLLKCKEHRPYVVIFQLGLAAQVTILVLSLIGIFK